MNVFWRCELPFTTCFSRRFQRPPFVEISRLRGLTDTHLSETRTRRQQIQHHVHAAVKLSRTQALHPGHARRLRRRHGRGARRARRVRSVRGRPVPAKESDPVMFVFTHCFRIPLIYRGNSLRPRTSSHLRFYSQEGRRIVSTHGGVHFFDVSRTPHPWDTLLTIYIPRRGLRER